EFEYVRLYRPWSRVLMFLASDAPLDVEIELARTGRPIVEDVLHFSRMGIYGVEDLLAFLAIDEQGMLSFARRAELSTDDNNLMATRSRVRADGLTTEDLQTLFEPYDPLLRTGSWVHTQLGGIDYGYLARRLNLTARRLRARRFGEPLATGIGLRGFRRLRPDGSWAAGIGDSGPLSGPRCCFPSLPVCAELRKTVRNLRFARKF
ncbi:MAG: hypothetical protein OXI74_09240, partial [Rhodospirillaceae bacterium]|nr:hypothetical protein [Rhodospirillaceae bacterium]